MAGSGAGQPRGSPGVVLSIRVTPRAKKNEIVQVLEDGTVKIRLTAPPVEGKANEALIHFLAEVLDIPPTRIKIISGMTGRNKRIQIVGLEVEKCVQKIEEWWTVHANR